MESHEEMLHIDAMQTGSKCPREIINLDLGICPARFYIKKYKLTFLHKTLNQQEDSSMLRFFKAPLDSPSKGDWVSEVKRLDYRIFNRNIIA